MEKVHELITIEDTKSEDSQPDCRAKESPKSTDVNKQLVQYMGWNGIEAEKNDFYGNKEEVNNSSESSDDENEGLTAYCGMEPDMEIEHSVDFILGYDSDTYLQSRNYNGETPLMLAISHKNQECASLIWTPTNINIATPDGRTVLHYLAMYGLEDLATQICAKRIININQQDDSGETALHVASGFNRIDMIEILLLHGADAGIKDSHGHAAGTETCSTRAQTIFQKWETKT
ncbi:poly [ADP-ribose] polymerase tankyrase-2-like [Daphnia carinata]|uniref:poly [ADP-ribose] polymerase tankyrase-2-like n=1 Tax=Daphnia carinata TaxID=120202 RepID=UPI00257949D8|nr:poly [ADP-ribose] polymerase tankyrase-2-like [Daphnia carinata]